jgi:hypothetical protein
MTDAEAAEFAEMKARLAEVERWIRQRKPRSSETKRLVEDWIQRGKGGALCRATGLRSSQ